MAKKDDSEHSETSDFVIGRRGFAKISAVEGIVLSGAMNQRTAEFDRDGLSDQQRREAIIRAHRRT